LTIHLVFSAFVLSLTQVLIVAVDAAALLKSRPCAVALNGVSSRLRFARF
jgi:hypothetical protein